MTGRSGWLLLTLLGICAGCSLETKKLGGTCQRSTQCVPGLACVQGKCSKDLSRIAAMNTVPMLGAGSGGARAGGAGGAGAGGEAGAAGDAQAGVGGDGSAAVGG